MSIKKNHNEDEWKDKYDYQINYNHIPKRWNISSNDPLPTRDWLALSVEEITIALTACENDSAPGPSQILYKAIKWAWEAHPLTLEYLYSNCINKGKYLLPFQPLLTAVAPKWGKGDYTDPGSFRPIQLTECTRKILDKIWTKGLQYKVTGHDIVQGS